tara:strand:- start:1546 stop:1779 length:234 start_codon:yes stop_codon:yes gene_type:complete
MKRSVIIKERLKECLSNGEISYTDEVEILQHLCNRLNLTTPAELARQRGLSFNGMKKRIQSGKEMVIELNGIELVCN